MKGRIIYPDDEKPWIQITSAKIISTKTQKLSKENSTKTQKLSKGTSTNILKTTVIVAISVFTTLAVAMIMGFQFTEITAEEQGKTGFTYSGNVTITGVFMFSEGEELVPIAVFTQTKGFQRTEPFIFVMQNIAGDTPLLHKHADEAFLFRNSEIQKQDYNPFDVDIIISNGGDLKRVFTYSKCFIDDYNVSTLRDNEEGYMNKGFAVVENYILECSSYQPHNPALEETMSMKENQKANTTSTMDLKEPVKTWRDYYKN